MARKETNPVVYVVDDDASVRKALSRLIASAGYVAETFASARQFLDQFRQRSEVVGCVVLDICMPELSGLDLQRELKSFIPAIPVVFLTGHGDISSSVRAMKDGAADFLTKPVDDEQLLATIVQALTRHKEVRARHAQWQELQRRADLLTPREHEVMALVVRGLLNKQVAAQLGTSEKTIKVHRARVIEKMGVQSLAELVLDAEKLGMFSPASGTGATLPMADRVPRIAGRGRLES